MPSSNPVCRLAPSPTGAQHLGNARTFLLAYWSARAQNAKLILRIEDIDSPRVKAWASAQAIEDLGWLGIEYDGDPIIQTERAGLYQSVLDRMIDDDRVYPCTCSRTDIETAASAPHEKTSANPSAIDRTVKMLAAETTIYPGTCSGWHCGDPLPPTGSYCWRFRTVDQPVTLPDLVVGSVRCDPARVIGDFPVTRKEGVAAYQLAVVVDDLDGRVTEVVRGDDLLVSTFRQRQIYDYLGETPPQYAHVPLVVGPDGRRLAKRHGDTRLSQYREQGVAPEKIVAWAARSSMGDMASLPSEGETESWDLDRWHREMIARFDWSNLPHDQVVYP